MLLIDISGIFRPMAYVAWENNVKATSSKDYSNPYNWDEDEFSFDDRLALEIRSRIITKLLEIKERYAKPKEEIVIAVDSRLNWRKKTFKEYKGKRGERRDKDNVDWKLCFKIINELMDDLRENFYFKIIKWEDVKNQTGCEADDVMGTLAYYKAGREDITAISDDGDFFQLHGISRFKQYNYKFVEKTKKLICKNLKIQEDYDITPEEFLAIKMLNGDTKDGVPNYQNDDDVWFDDNKKYKSLGVKTSMKILLGEDEKILNKFGSLEEIKETDGYKRNSKMLDLKNIPQDIKDHIIDEYLNYEYKGSLRKIQQYLSQKCATGSNRLQNSARKFVIGNINSNPTGRINPFKRFIN